MSNEDPLSVVEGLAQSNDWPFERDDDNDVKISVKGNWAQYRICFTWDEEDERLHLSCSFELNPVPHRQNEVKELIALINADLWIGHLDLWLSEGYVHFRHGMPFIGEARPSTAFCERVLTTALGVCEKYYPAFNYVLWAGKTAKEAVEAVNALADVQGEA